MGEARVPSQVPTHFAVVDISSGLTSMPANTIAVSFRVTGAGTVTFQGHGASSSSFERKFDTGTYTVAGRFDKVGPGTTAVIAVLDPANEVVAESVAGPPA